MSTKRPWLFLLAVVMVVGIAGCSSDGEGVNNYNFNGTWNAAYTVTVSNGPDEHPVGHQGTFQMKIVQNGSAISIDISDGEESPPLTGAADGNHFTASGDDSSITVSINGTGATASTMTGTGSMWNYALTHGVSFTFTALLVSR